MSNYNLRETYESLISSLGDGITRQNGFLPNKVPGSPLPPSFNFYQRLVAELPNQLIPYSNTSVRNWLKIELDNYEYILTIKDIDNLSIEQLNNALTILTILMQSYRWDRLPADPEVYSEDKVDFPEALYNPWKIVSCKLDLPLSNTYWSVIASNWQLNNKLAGDEYCYSDFSESTELLYTWLPDPYHNELKEFILSFVDMESTGAFAIASVLDTLNCGINKDNEGVIKNLKELNHYIQLMGHVFSKRIRKNKISLDHWRDIIHVPFAWGLIDESGIKREGASGMQLGSVAVLNSFFAIEEKSSLGSATRNSRIYLLPNQREFLAKLDTLGFFMKKYVQTYGGMDMISAFNECLNSLSRWRVSHQKRGILYLSHNVTKDTPQIATGLTIDPNKKTASVADIFESDMNERIQETIDAKLSSI